MNDDLIWADPCECLAESIEPKYVLVCGKTYHKLFPNGREIIKSEGARRLQKKDWELFIILKENDEFYWGQFVKGLGLIEVMVPKINVRNLTKSEKKFWSGRTLGMYGSYSGNLSYTFNLGKIK